MKKCSSSFILLLTLTLALAQTCFARDKTAMAGEQDRVSSGILTLSSNIRQRHSEPEINHLHSFTDASASPKTQHALDGMATGRWTQNSVHTFHPPVFLARGSLLIKSYLWFIYPSHNFW